MKRVRVKRVRAKQKRTPISARDLAIGAVIDILVGLFLMLIDRLIDIFM